MAFRVKLRIVLAHFLLVLVAVQACGTDNSTSSAVRTSQIETDPSAPMLTPRITTPSRGTEAAQVIVATKKGEAISAGSVIVGPVINKNAETQPIVPTTTTGTTNFTATPSQSLQVGITSSSTTAPSTLPAEIPCSSIAKFALVNGSYRSNLGKKACLEATVQKAGARLPGGAIHISFTGYADIEGIIPANVRVRFEKSEIEQLAGKKVRLHGVFGLSSLVKVPILEVTLPEQIEVLT